MRKDAQLPKIRIYRLIKPIARGCREWRYGPTLWLICAPEYRRLESRKRHLPANADARPLTIRAQGESLPRYGSFRWARGANISVGSPLNARARRKLYIRNALPQDTRVLLSRFGTR